MCSFATLLVKPTFKMFQRVQSFFLLIVAGAMAAIIFLPLWSKQNPQGNEVAKLTATHLTLHKSEQLISQNTTIFIAILAGVVVGLALFSVSRYQNRLLQMQIGLINSILMAAVLGISVYFSFEGERLLLIQGLKGTYHIAFYLIAAAMLSNLLANRFIRMDQRKVEEAFSMSFRKKS